MCSINCHNESCPFAMTNESEYAQGMGCLPSAYEILIMRLHHNINWECHSEKGKVCTGLLIQLKEYGIKHDRTLPIIGLDDDYSKFTKPIEGGIDIRELDLLALSKKYSNDGAYSL